MGKIVVQEENAKWPKKDMQVMEVHGGDAGCVDGEVPRDKESTPAEITA